MSRLQRRALIGALGSETTTTGEVPTPLLDEECTRDIIMVRGFGNTGVVISEEGVVVVDTTQRTS